MGQFKENQTILRTLGIILIVLVLESLYAIGITIYSIVSTHEYNKLYKEATEKIKQDDLQIKQLMIENRDLSIEYNDLLKDNEDNKKQIEWLNEQMVNLKGE